MDVFTTPGAFSWSELMTSDPAKAAEFYGGLFGWTIETMDMPIGKYYVAKVGDVAVGGMMACPAEAGAMPPAWGTYVTVAAVDETVQRCEAMGGKVLMPPMDVPTVGRMACIQDPLGAVLNVISYFPREG